jgi:hypothetical protein
MRNRQTTPLGMRRVLLGILGTIWVAGLTACDKINPSAASSGGGAGTQRNVLTVKGAAR